jgi:hypothetical protein
MHLLSTHKHPVAKPSLLCIGWGFACTDSPWYYNPMLRCNSRYSRTCGCCGCPRRWFTCTGDTALGCPRAAEFMAAVTFARARIICAQVRDHDWSQQLRELHGTNWIRSRMCARDFYKHRAAAALAAPMQLLHETISVAASSCAVHAYDRYHDDTCSWYRS